MIFKILNLNLKNEFKFKFKFKSEQNQTVQINHYKIPKKIVVELLHEYF